MGNDRMNNGMVHVRRRSSGSRHKKRLTLQEEAHVTRRGSHYEKKFMS